MGDAAALVHVLDEFVWVLRREGFPVSTAQAIDVIRAVDAVGLERMVDVRAAIAAIVLHRRDERRHFDETFAAFFTGAVAMARRQTLWQRLNAQGLEPSEIDAVRQILEERDAESSENAPSLMTILERGAPLDRLIARASPADCIDGHSRLQLGFRAYRLIEQLGAGAALRTLAELRERLPKSLAARGLFIADALAHEWRLFEQEVHAHVRASYERRVRDVQREREQGRLKATPFASLSRAELEDVRRGVQRLAERMRSGRRVRWTRATRKGRIDPHLTLRAALRTGGVPFALTRRPRRMHRRVVLLCDVSDSVRAAASVLLEFAYAAQELFARTRSFVFVSDLAEITDLFKRQPACIAIPNAWQGGFVPHGQNSNYGRVLQEFEARYSREIDGGTTLIILGDGRTNYHRPRADVLERLRRRSRALLWLCTESRGQWGRSDSAMGAYARACTAVYEVTCAGDFDRIAQLLVARR
ncbi:MAG: VWA domain-containing protein [Myxococcota bacterium]|nr:VWA domain-containing protein [Myxococcota bacterium]